MALLLFLLVVVAGYLAFTIGKWRQICMYCEVNQPYNVPLGWRKPVFRIVSWILVSVFSLIFATIPALLISKIYPWLGAFLWGALLTTRWGASAIATAKKLAEMEK